MHNILNIIYKYKYNILYEKILQDNYYLCVDILISELVVVYIVLIYSNIYDSEGDVYKYF